jgi:C-terminal processing protease CtpA/Prc
VKPLVAIALLLVPACAFLEGELPTQPMPLYDMEEPLGLHEEPQDEEQRLELPRGGFTGIYVSDSRQSLEEMEEEPEGVLVASVVENSPADAAGLEEGDLLLEVEGVELGWASEWRNVELHAEPGTTLRVVYDRAGAEREAEVGVQERLRPFDRQEAQRYREEQRVGIVVRTATEVEARAAGLGPGGGAVVVGLARTSPWRAAGLRYEDLIVRIGDEPVAHPDVLLRAIRDVPEDGEVEIVFVREEESRTIEAPVSRRAGQITKVTIPLLFGYEKDRDQKRVWALFWIYQRKRTPAAWEIRLFWLITFRGGDADRLEEVSH